MTGQPIVVGVHPSIKDDCTRGPLAEIQLVEKSRHGAMAVQGGRITLNDGPCPPMDATARRVLYRSELTFVGEDELAATWTLTS